MQKKVKVVVIGGGTGTFTVLTGLKHFPDCDLTAIVTMTDNGSSTGRLRDEFGRLPVGDIRQCLVALAREDEASILLRQLFNFRFPESKSGLSGHNFGNLFLTALTEILGDEVKAIEAAAEILNVTGHILPVTKDNVDLVAEYENGDILMGEKNIDEPGPKHDCTTRIVELWTQPSAAIYAPSREAILAADFIVIGPGDLYSSLLSNVVVDGVPEAIQQNQGKFIYVGNLVSKYGQTHGLKQSEYLAEVEKYVGRKPDYVLLNSQPLSDEILVRYEEEQSYPVVDDLTVENVRRADLLSNETVQRASGDTVKRSLLRHDSHKLAQELLKLFNENVG
jgi:uncharacterized cofD-like protein